MTSTNGTFENHPAVKYNNGQVYFQVAGHWYQAIGQESKFKPN